MDGNDLTIAIVEVGPDALEERLEGLEVFAFLAVRPAPSPRRETRSE